jgi:PhnB protein
MMRLDPYLNFNGNTEEAFLFYKSVFGGAFTSFIRFTEMPGSEKMDEDDRGKLMHVALPVGDNNVLMATDALSSMNQQLNAGDNFSINITLDNESETRRLFEGLSEGGEVIMPLKKEAWSDLFGLCKDKFGIQWMFNYYKK